MSHEFSHLRTTYFIRKNTYFPYAYFSYKYFSYIYFSYTYFSYTCVLLEHNGVLLQHSPVLSEHNRVETSQSTMKSSQSTMEDGISKNTKKIVESYITWLLYNQNPLRSNMAQPYRLIVWIYTPNRPGYSGKLEF